MLYLYNGNNYCLISIFMISDCSFAGRPHISAPDLSIIEEWFSDSNVTAILKYQAHAYNQSENYYGTILNITIKVTPHTIVVSNTTHIELMLLYNTLYNISSSISLCGLTGPSTTDELFYGE